MFQLFIILLLCVSTLYAKILPYKITPNTKVDTSIQINILDAKRLDFPNVHELSALAYKHANLYALSDKGILYLFECQIKNDKIHKFIMPLKIKTTFQKI